MKSGYNEDKTSVVPIISGYTTFLNTPYRITGDSPIKRSIIILVVLFL